MPFYSVNMLKIRGGVKKDQTVCEEVVSNDAYPFHKPRHHRLGYVKMIFMKVGIL